MAETPRAPSPSLRFRVLTRDQFACRYCGRKAPDVRLVVDHVYPYSRGGETREANLVSACVECNAGKCDHVIPGTEPPPPTLAGADPLEILQLLHDILGYSMPENLWEGSDTDLVNSVRITLARAQSLEELRRDLIDLLDGCKMAAARGITLGELEDEMDRFFGNG